jgi:fucose 4-O-acetylase-like acetyltransferase
MTQYVQERIVKMETPYMAWMLVVMIFAFVLCYAFFVNAAIANIVATKDMQAEVSAITSSVATLEATYLAAQSSLVPESSVIAEVSPASSDTLYIAKAPAESLSFNR